VISKDTDIATFILEGASADLDDVEVFVAHLKRGMELLELDAEAVAQLVDVPRPSVERWLAGETTPSPVVRGLVYAELSEQAVARF
jgi:hypothetical protein